MWSFMSNDMSTITEIYMEDLCVPLHIGLEVTQGHRNNMY